jgi:hypothetical protein
MFFQHRINLFFLTSLLLSACTTPLTQQEVAREFWTAVASDNPEKAKTFVKSGDTADYSAIDSLLIEKVNLNAHRDLDGKTCVPTTATVTERGEPKALHFRTFLEKEKGEWKIDLHETAESIKSTTDK